MFSSESASGDEFSTKSYRITPWFSLNVCVSTVRVTVKMGGQRMIESDTLLNSQVIRSVNFPFTSLPLFKALNKQLL